MRTGISVAAGADRSETGRQVVDRSAVEHGRIIETDGARHPVAELRGVLDVVHAGDGGFTAEQERRVVARITMPRSGIGRSRLTEGEARELDEHELNRGVAFAGIVEEGRGGRYSGRNRRVGSVVAEGLELEVGLTEGADDAVFRGGAGIDRQRHTGAGSEVIAVAILLTEVTRPRRLIVEAAVERGVNAQ